MAQTVTIDEKTLHTILTRLDRLTRDVQVIKDRVLEKEPVSGSDAWWEKEVNESERAFEKGEGIRFDSAEEAIQWLNS